MSSITGTVVHLRGGDRAHSYDALSDGHVSWEVDPASGNLHLVGPGNSVVAEYQAVYWSAVRYLYTD